jgi:hypothetical protein
MNFQIEKAVPLLASTPPTLRALLGGLDAEWTDSEGTSEGWAPFDVVGHLIHGEETDWIPRARIILSQAEDRTFEPFDRFAHFERSKGKTLAALLDEFEYLRNANLETLSSWELTNAELDLQGVHPELGSVTLRQLLATWVVHDLTHIRQVATVMARRYAGEVGPWKEYLSILS